MKIIPPIRRKNHLLPTSPLHSKGRNENQKLRTPTNRSRQDIIILQEPFRVFSADVHLDEEAESEVD